MQSINAAEWVTEQQNIKILTTRDLDHAQSLVRVPQKFFKHRGITGHYGHGSKCLVLGDDHRRYAFGYMVIDHAD